MQHRRCSPLCGILLLFSPTYAHKQRGRGEGGNCPSRTGRSRGVCPPSRDYHRTTVFLLLLGSSICTCKIGLNCSEMLLPADSVWNFVAFAHLCCLKIVLRFCIEGQAWVRVGVSRAVKAASSTVAAKQLVEAASIAAANQLV